MGALGVNVLFREPKDVHTIIALTGKQDDDGILGTAFFSGNHAVARMAKNERGYVLIHELGHLFGAVDIENPNSVMHFEYSPSLDWDEQNKQTVLKNKNRPWVLYDYEKGLYEQLHQWKNNSRAIQKLREVAILDNDDEEGKAARKLEKLVKQYPQEKFLFTVMGCEPLISVRMAKRKLKVTEIPGDEPKRPVGRSKLQIIRWGIAYFFQIIRELWHWK